MTFEIVISAIIAVLSLSVIFCFHMIIDLLKLVAKLSKDLAECCEQLSCGQFAY